MTCVHLEHYLFEKKKKRNTWTSEMSWKAKLSKGTISRDHAVI